ncbi:tryptophan synthase subunit alpha [Hugenholtzia roseola]|uniref:tryptophan synthase subunit alpha n=1 Tax=Hugenholtzia roseola TaxID=1002 RepID=UPI000406A7A7|nr:tryptophan synthase subunit alpha [Hugenholtzia roseola]
MNATGTYLALHREALAIYFTADFPKKGDTTSLILALQAAGADLIEVGLPFSDPLADGVVIQQSSQKALANGFEMQALFAELKALRPQVRVPLVLMGYFNTVLAYNVSRFLADCNQAGIDTVILPDLPLEVYQDEYRALFEAQGVSLAFLITPQTARERVDLMVENSHAFLYVVADNSITGKSSGLSEAQKAYFERVKGWNLPLPTLIGFGIAEAQSFQTACQYANGAIVGSAFIKKLEQAEQEGQDLNQTVQDFVKNLKAKPVLS